MALSRTTFISFRRIRYHEASFAYRDLMLSGAMPWLSDHCITPDEALHFLEHPEVLAPLLQKAISASDFALVLVDQGYFQSPWTRLEFDQITAQQLPGVIVVLDSAELPASLNQQMSSSLQVFPTLRAGMEKLCHLMEIQLVPFAGHRLCYHTDSSVRGFSFQCPWLSSSTVPGAEGFSLHRNPFQNRWHNDYGDSLWFHWSSIKRSPATEILALLKAGDSSKVESLHSLFEDELWQQVHRLRKLPHHRLKLIGYHKLVVPAIQSTAVALSLQCSSASGFCRYASLLLPESEEKLELACFIRGSLQRFQCLIPDIDKMILSFGSQKGRDAYDEDGSVFSNVLPRDLIWARCAQCKSLLTARSLGGDQCQECGSALLECPTVHCRERFQLRFHELTREADREKRESEFKKLSHQGIFDKGVFGLRFFRHLIH